MGNFASKSTKKDSGPRGYTLSAPIYSSINLACLYVSESKIIFISNFFKKISDYYEIDVSGLADLTKSCYDRLQAIYPGGYVQFIDNKPRNVVIESRSVDFNKIDSETQVAITGLGVLFNPQGRGVAH